MTAGLSFYLHVKITQVLKHKINLVYLLQASKHVPHNPLGEIRPVIEYQWCASVA